MSEDKRNILVDFSKKYKGAFGLVENSAINIYATFADTYYHKKLSALQSELATAQEEVKRMRKALESINTEIIRWGKVADISLLSHLAQSALNGVDHD